MTWEEISKKLFGKRTAKNKKIEEILWNLTDAKSEEEFNELYKPYLDKAKRCF